MTFSTPSNPLRRASRSVLVCARRGVRGRTSRFVTPTLRLFLRVTFHTSARALVSARAHEIPSYLPFFLPFFVSPAAERLITTKEEVNALRARFEAELARQASKAAQANKMALASRRQGVTAPPGDRDRKSRMRTTKKSGAGGDQKAEFLALPPQAGTPPAKPAKGKKKKRSALANASNPHHLRNYVPSRLPHSSGGGHHAASSTPQDENVPINFLSKGIGKGALINPADEWVCPFCEYELFYGDEAEYRRAIRNRKKILRRRRRARERASAAASGQAHGANARGKGREEEEDEGYDDEALYDPPADTYVPPAPVQQKWDPGRGGGQQKGAQAATG